jgi:WD40 repeat protein
MVLATADDFGTVKLYKFPAPKDREMPHHREFGHSSHVTNVSFTTDGSHVVTTGGEDKCIFMWRHGDEMSVVTPAKTVTVDEFAVENENEEGDEALAVQPSLGTIRSM